MPHKIYVPHKRGDGPVVFDRVEFLILDAVGLGPLNHQQEIDILKIMDQKVHRGSVAILTRVSLSLWHKIVLEVALAMKSNARTKIRKQVQNLTI